MNLFDSNSVKDILPDELNITTSNGNFCLKKSDCTVAPPQIFISYHHSTPESTGDVLSDGEPDYLSFDLQFISNPQKCKCDITYGDAMMFSFDLTKGGSIDVGHYNGYNSKFDPKSEFYFDEESIQSIIKFLSKMTNFDIRRDMMNFLDGNKNSYKYEKVNYRRIVDFKRFNPLNLL
jgi:hypothetical protein